MILTRGYVDATGHVDLSQVEYKRYLKTNRRVMLVSWSAVDPHFANGEICYEDPCMSRFPFLVPFVLLEPKNA